LRIGIDRRIERDVRIGLRIGRELRIELRVDTLRVFDARVRLCRRFGIFDPSAVEQAGVQEATVRRATTLIRRAHDPGVDAPRASRIASRVCVALSRKNSGRRASSSYKMMPTRNASVRTSAWFCTICSGARYGCGTASPTEERMLRSSIEHRPAMPR